MIHAPHDPKPPPAGESARERFVRPLRVMLESEARRAQSDVQIAPDPERLAQGWKRRFVADEGRVAELVQLYHELGYETLLDPLSPHEVDPDCAGCLMVSRRRLMTIYTRPRSAPASTAERT